MDSMREELSSSIVQLQKNISRHRESTKETPSRPGGHRLILRFNLILSLHLGYELFQLGIGTAYLYEDLKILIHDPIRGF